MKWSIPIGVYAGIKVQIHLTFIALLVWIGFSIFTSQQSAMAAAIGVGFILSLFLCVVLHEYGHALMARRFGVGTRDITLLPIGGVARLERMPEKPSEELLVALAGPAVNVVIAIVLAVGLSVAGRPLSFAEPLLAEQFFSGAGFAERLLSVNLLLIGFNMLPAFPMDGGRVLRALLAMRMSYARATRAAATVGQGFAFLFGAIGLFYNPFLLIIAVFVWLGAAQEAAVAQVRGALDGIPLASAMMTDFRTLAPTDPLSHAVELLLAGSQQDFPVEDDGRIVGLLTRQTLFAALAKREDDALVGTVMRADVPTAEREEMLNDALLRLQTTDVRTMPVLSGGRIVGLLTMENVGEYMSVRTALERASAA